MSVHGKRQWVHENEIEFDSGPGDGYHWETGPEAYVNSKGVLLQEVEKRPNSGVKEGHIWSPWEIIQYDKGKRYIHGTNDREGWIFPEAFLEDLHIGDRVRDKTTNIVGTITKMTLDHIFVIDAQNQPHRFEYHVVEQAPKPTQETDTPVVHVCKIPRRRLMQAGAVPQVFQMVRPWDMHGPAGDPRAWDFRVETFFYRYPHLDPATMQPTGDSPRNAYVVMPEIANLQPKGLESVDALGIPKALENQLVEAGKQAPVRAKPFSKVHMTPGSQEMFDAWKRHIYEVIHTLFGGYIPKGNSVDNYWQMKDLHDFFSNENDNALDFLLTREQILRIGVPGADYTIEYPVAFPTVNLMYESFRSPQKTSGIGSKSFAPFWNSKHYYFGDKQGGILKRPNLTNLYMVMLDAPDDPDPNDPPPPVVPLQVAKRLYDQHGGFHALRAKWKEEKRKFPKGFVKLIKAYIVMVCMGEYRGSLLSWDFALSGDTGGQPRMVDDPADPRHWLTYDANCRQDLPAEIAVYKEMKKAGIFPDDQTIIANPVMVAAPAPVGQAQRVSPGPSQASTVSAGSLGGSGIPLANDIDLHEWPYSTLGSRSATPQGNWHSAFKKSYLSKSASRSLSKTLSLSSSAAPEASASVALGGSGSIGPNMDAGAGPLLMPHTSLSRSVSRSASASVHPGALCDSKEHEDEDEPEDPAEETEDPAEVMEAGAGYVAQLRQPVKKKASGPNLMSKILGAQKLTSQSIPQPPPPIMGDRDRNRRTYACCGLFARG